MNDLEKIADEIKRYQEPIEDYGKIVHWGDVIISDSVAILSKEIKQAYLDNGMNPKTIVNVLHDNFYTGKAHVYIYDSNYYFVI